MKRLFAPLFVAVCTAAACWLPPAAANCKKNPDLSAKSDQAIPLDFGRVNLATKYLQPPGSLLASIVVPPTDHIRFNADTELWQCDKADLPNLRFLVSTNGDSRFGGHNDVGGPDGLSKVYATWFEQVGLRMSMNGVALSRTWRAVPVTTYYEYEVNGKAVISIRLQDIPPLHAELYRVSQDTPLAGANICSTGRRHANAEGRRYDCKTANGYIQLTGYGNGSGQDHEGEDHNTHHRFWLANNGIAYKMHLYSFLVAQPSCAVRSAPAQVSFAPISAERLNHGDSVAVPFNVQIECEDAARSGTGKNQVTIGIQVSPGAWRAAQQLGLVNSAGGVTALISDQYGKDATLAQGVGITLTDSFGSPVNFVGQPNDSPISNATAAGWHPVRYGSKKTGAGERPGHSLYERHYTARLRQLPGRTATAGRVHATAQVMVKVQ